MQGCLASGFIRVVRVRAVLEEELTELPMPMKRRAPEIEILSKAGNGLATIEQEPNRAHVAVVGAPFDQRDAGGVCRLRRVRSEERRVGKEGRSRWAADA